MSTPPEVHQRWLGARSRWPDVEVSLESFAEHLATVQITPSDTPDLRFDDLYLALACSLGDRAALRHFDAELIAAARPSITRLDANAAFVDEVLQRTRTKLLVARADGPAPVARFSGQGSLTAWVTVSAVRLALSALAQQRRDTPLDDATWAVALSLPSLPNAELEVLKDRHRSEVAEALRHACGALSSRDRTIMRLHFVDGLNSREIARIYAVHRATVNRWLVATKEQLAAAVQQHLIQQIGAGPRTVDELTALVRSQLDISMSQLLQTASG